MRRDRMGWAELSAGSAFRGADGAAAGVGTILLMFTNGISVGVITTACTQNHMALGIWSFVAAHGALEIPRIRRGEKRVAIGRDAIGER